MAKFSRIQVIIAMERTGLVPLFYHEDIEICKKIVDALYKGGARLLEFTARGDFSHEVFGKLSKYCNTQYHQDNYHSTLYEILVLQNPVSRQQKSNCCER